MEPYITSKTITFGVQNYRVNAKGEWQVQTFGFHINNPNASRPTYQWYPIPTDKVPKEVIKLNS